MPLIPVDFLNIILHLDKYLVTILNEYGIWIYIILFCIIFLETGIVLTPFLPGDSLLFAVGALAAQGSLDILVLYLLLAAAAILGDTVNYWVGYSVGAKIFTDRRRFLKREYLAKTERFYERHGGKTIIIARFLPVIRTFAPFIAGIGRMRYGKFLSYNVIGGLLWVGLFLIGGYYFGSIPVIKENFAIVILIIISLSFVPAISEYIKHRRNASKVKAQ